MFTYVVNIGHLSSDIWFVILDASESVSILENPEQTDTVLIWCVLARGMQNSAQPKNLGKLGYNIYIFRRVIVFTTHLFSCLSTRKHFVSGMENGVLVLVCRVSLLSQSFLLNFTVCFSSFFFLFASAYFLVTNAAWLGRKWVQNVLLKKTSVQCTETYRKALLPVTWDRPLDHQGIKTEEQWSKMLSTLIIGG